MLPRSDYLVLEVKENAVLLQDSDRGGPSVTNDAEAVVRHINRMYPNRRIFYYDSEGILDELVHANGVFDRFAPGYAWKDLK